MFSPRMRGCSVIPQVLADYPDVFPAYAGMFRTPLGPFRCLLRFPRVCGDVPWSGSVPQALARFSPRMRGCSVADGASEAVHPVFPHTRGCSVLGGFTSGDRSVFPAYAGMFRTSEVSAR